MSRERPELREHVYLADVAFDPTQRLVREGRAISIVGQSAADGLAAGLRWVPFADPSVHMHVQLVLREGEPAGVADRFERVAIAHAASAGWLDDLEAAALEQDRGGLSVP
jgi:hypothetical protein